MTTDEVLRMALEAGFKERNGTIRTMHSSGAWVGINDELERFAKLVATDARAARIAAQTENEELKTRLAARISGRDELLEALRKIIDLNIQYCIDKYGDASNAETMDCVITARAAIAKATGAA